MNLSPEVTSGFGGAQMAGGRSFGMGRNVNDALGQQARRLALQKTMGNIGALQDKLGFEAQQPGALDAIGGILGGVTGLNNVIQGRQQQDRLQSLMRAYYGGTND